MSERRYAILDDTGKVPAVQMPDVTLPGLIVLWRGDVAPTGWRKCDGTLGTPNLAALAPHGPGFRLIYIQKV